MLSISNKFLIVTALIFGTWFLYEVRQVLALLFVAFILVSGLHPLVIKMVSKKVPRSLAIIIVFLGLIAFIALGLIAILPPLVRETVDLIRNSPYYLSPFLAVLNISPADFTPQLAPLSSGIVKATVTIFSDVISFVALLVLTLYALIERDNLKEDLERHISVEKTEKIMVIVGKVEEKLGSWVNGQAVLCVIIGVATYIGLRLLNIQYALPLAIMAGMLEILPTMGPLISSVPSVLLGISVSPLTGLAVAALYLLIQQTENHFLVPQIMKKAVGLPPLVTIIAIMVGAKIAGIPGAILAIPLLLTIQTIFESISLSRNPLK